jgi:hypothetical protein
MEGTRCSSWSMRTCASGGWFIPPAQLLACARVPGVGAAAAQSGRLDEGFEYLTRAIAATPSHSTQFSDVRVQVAPVGLLLCWTVLVLSAKYGVGWGWVGSYDRRNTKGFGCVVNPLSGRNLKPMLGCCQRVVCCMCMRVWMFVCMLGSPISCCSRCTGSTTTGERSTTCSEPSTSSGKWWR